jgi:hypothetical protein
MAVFIAEYSIAFNDETDCPGHAFQCPVSGFKWLVCITALLYQASDQRSQHHKSV